ncbi:DUF4007 family protein [Alphaproteobacteria bacterium]|jgi:hypothetical protein|nr:DUF4007 family protein [Alphaproteobacteria bacterium]
MISGPFSTKYKPKFSGHETFPLRYPWIPKITEKLNGNNTDFEKTKYLLEADNGIIEFGVGRNMVKSIEHWAKVTGILEQSSEGKKLSKFGKSVFKNYDPYLENHSSIWLLHWQLGSNPQLTTWFYIFNYLNSVSFTKEQIIMEMMQLTKDLNWIFSSENTIKRDVDVFIRSYTHLKDKKNNYNEESFESPLSELGIIKHSSVKNSYDLILGNKKFLDPKVIAYSVFDYGYRLNQMIIPLDKICSDYGSPGRVFKIDENSMISILSDIKQHSNGLLNYSETAGHKQIILDVASHKELIENIYKK